MKQKKIKGRHIGKEKKRLKNSDDKERKIRVKRGGKRGNFFLEKLSIKLLTNLQIGSGQFFWKDALSLIFM